MSDVSLAAPPAAPQSNHTRATRGPIDNFDPGPPPPPVEATNGHHAWYDRESELHLVASMLVFHEHLDDVLAIVRPEDLSAPGGNLLAALIELTELGEGIDAHTLTRHPLVDNPGLTKTLDSHVTSAWRSHAHRLADLAQRRRVHATATALAAAARDGSEGDINEARQAVTDLTGRTTTNSWTQIDLEIVLAGEQLTEPPAILHRDDGQALIYPGKIHAFNAESESGKSWLALAACVEQLHDKRPVIYLDFEDGAEGVTERLLALGATHAQIVTHFVYVRPDDPIDPAAINQLKQTEPALVVIDGVTEAMVQNGWSIKENDDFAHLLARLARPFARHGAAVILIDHVVKKKDERGDYAIGGQHKRAGLDGAGYKLEVIRPFGRGLSGTAKITVTKDRPGHIRPACVAGRNVGELRLSSVGDTATLTINAPASAGDPDAAFRPTRLMERISRTIEDSNNVGVKPSVSQILTSTRGSRDHLISALKALTTERFVTVEVHGQSHLHVASKPYREGEDPLSDSFVALSEEPHEEF